MRNAQKLLLSPLALTFSLAVFGARQGFALEQTASQTVPMAGVAIDSAILSRDKAGKSVTTRLKPTDNLFYCRVRLAGPGNGTKIKAAWIAVDAAGNKNLLIASKELVTPGRLNIANFTFSLPRNLPTGIYRTNIYLNGKLARVINFTVR